MANDTKEHDTEGKHQIQKSPLNFQWALNVVAGAGFEPTTFGL